MSRPALFLDRDGVINIDHGYVHRVEDFHFVDGIFDLCAAARARDMPVVIVTNQAGIGRGYYTEADFHALMAWVSEEFATRGTPLAGVYFSPDHPEHGIGAYRRDSDRRKPGSGMLREAIAEHGLNPVGSVMVGDKASDMQAALGAGITHRLLVSEDAREIAAMPAGGVVLPSIVMAAAWVRAIG